MVTIWYVRIKLGLYSKETAWTRRGMCELSWHGLGRERHVMVELPYHGITWERHGHGIEWVN